MFFSPFKFCQFVDLNLHFFISTVECLFILIDHLNFFCDRLNLLFIVFISGSRSSFAHSPEFGSLISIFGVNILKQKMHTNIYSRTKDWYRFLRVYFVSSLPSLLKVEGNLCFSLVCILLVLE